MIDEQKQPLLAPVGRRILDLAEEPARPLPKTTKPPPWFRRMPASPVHSHVHPQPMRSNTPDTSITASATTQPLPCETDPESYRLDSRDAKACVDDQASFDAVIRLHSNSSPHGSAQNRASPSSQNSANIFNGDNVSNDSPGRPPSKQAKSCLRGRPETPSDDGSDAGMNTRGAGIHQLLRFVRGCAAFVPRSVSRRLSRDRAHDIDVHAIAIDLLVLGFAVCAGTTVDCMAFAQSLSPADCLALKRLAQQASQRNPHRNLADSAKAFLGPVEFISTGGSEASEGRRQQKGYVTGGTNLGSGGTQGSQGPARAAFQRGRSLSKMSLGSKASSRGSDSDVSETSFADFGRKHSDFRIHPNQSAPRLWPDFQSGGSTASTDCTPKISFLAFMDSQEAVAKLRPTDNSRPFVMELNLEAQAPVLERKRSVHFDENCFVSDQISVIGGQEKSEAGYSAVSAVSAISYNSMCDAVLVGEDGEKEMVQAEVVNLGKHQGGPQQVRIAFLSQCLRTQNEWQRQLLKQQRSLVHSMSTQLQDTQQMLQTKDEVQEEEKELLKSFRKIITREVDTSDKSLSLEVFVLEKSKEISDEIKELCKILEYPCRIFNSFTAIKEAVKNMQERNQVEISPSSPSPKRRARQRSVFSNRSGSRSRSVTSASLESSEIQPLGAVFLGSDWVSRDLPAEWKRSTVYVVLTSQPEEFEEIGRKLFASGSSEIHECLVTRGFSEYLLHPLSLEGIRKVLTGAMCRHFGQEFLLTKVIGRGASSVVYRAKRLGDGALFALKEINTMRLSKSAQADTANECEILRMLQWPTVLELVDAWFVSRDKLRYLLMPLFEGGDIDQYIIAVKKSGAHSIPQMLVTDWYVQSLHGLSYLHSSGVLHRDIKPGNFLLGQDDRVLQIADLGHASTLPGPGPHPARRNSVQAKPCTPLYSAPELAPSIEVACTASDMWALGVSFYEMLTMDTLFPQTSREDLWELIAAFDPEVRGGPKNLAFSTFDILRSFGDMEVAVDIQKMLRRDPFGRPTAAGLALRPNIIKRIYDVIKETKLSSYPDDHMEDFKILLKDSQDAEHLDPPQADAANAEGNTESWKKAAKEKRRAKQFAGMKQFMNTV